MAFAKLIAFDRPLQGVAIPGQSSRPIPEREVAQREEAAYQRGVDAARALADQQMVDFRADVEQLGDGIFQKLTALEPMLVAQLRETLPALAVDIARRLLAGYEPAPEVVARICEEALAGIFPERENLEVSVSTRDAAVLEQLKPAWLAAYPGIKIRADAGLAPGDCMVRSRFGLTDARLQTKLTALEHSLSPS